MLGIAGFTLLSLLLPRRHLGLPTEQSNGLLPPWQLVLIILFIAGYVVWNLWGAESGHNRESNAWFTAWQLRPLAALSFWILGLLLGHAALFKKNKKGDA